MNQQTNEVKDIKDDLIAFIEKQVLTTEFFDAWWWKDVEILEARNNGDLVLRMKVQSKHANMMGSLHGGTTAAIFDQVGSWSVVLADQLKWSLSTNLSIIYMSTCPIGESIIIKGTCDKLGKTLAYSTINIYNEKDNRLVSTAKLTKLRPITEKI